MKRSLAPFWGAGILPSIPSKLIHHIANSRNSLLSKMYNIVDKNKFKNWLVIFLMTSILTISGCGGGGGGASGNNADNDSEGTVEVKVNSDVITINDNNKTEIIQSNSDSEDDTQLTLSGDLAESVKNGALLTLLQGADDRFPLGLAGRVATSTTNSDGTKTVGLEQVSYAEIIEESASNLGDIPLDESNFIGVIAPAGVQAASRAGGTARRVLGRNGYSFRDGAIINDVVIDCGCRSYRWLRFDPNVATFRNLGSYGSIFL